MSLGEKNYDSSIKTINVSFDYISIKKWLGWSSTYNKGDIKHPLKNFV
jgi:hypothetical protein